MIPGETVTVVKVFLATLSEHQHVNSRLRNLFSCGMFSCISDPSSVRGSSNDESFGRIAQESERLRTKCKSLRTLLLETETKRCEEKKEYEDQIGSLQRELDNCIAELQAQSFTQLSEMRDYRTNEVNELNNQLVASRNEVSMQGALIIALTRKVTYLEKTLEDAQLQCKNTVDAARRECDQQLTQMSLARDSAATITTQQQHANLMRRAVLAEAEISKLKASLAEAHGAATSRSSATATADSEVHAAITRLEKEKQKLTEDLKQLREENALLEKQARTHQHSYQSGAAAAVPSTVSPRMRTAPRFSPSPVGELNSEGRQRLAAEEQVNQLKGRLQEVLDSRAAVEAAVRTVMADNERLAREVDALAAALAAERQRDQRDTITL